MKLCLLSYVFKKLTFDVYITIYTSQKVFLKEIAISAISISSPHIHCSLCPPLWLLSLEKQSFYLCVSKMYDHCVSLSFNASAALLTELMAAFLSPWIHLALWQHDLLNAFQPLATPSPFTFFFAYTVIVDGTEFIFVLSLNISTSSWWCPCLHP